MTYPRRQSSNAQSKWLVLSRMSSWKSRLKYPTCMGQSRSLVVFLGGQPSYSNSRQQSTVRSGRTSGKICGCQEDAFHVKDAVDCDLEMQRIGIELIGRSIKRGNWTCRFGRQKPNRNLPIGTG